MKNHKNSRLVKAKLARLLIIDNDSNTANKLGNFLSESFQVSISNHGEAKSVLKNSPTPDIVLANCSSGNPAKYSSDYAVLFSFIKKNMPDINLVILASERDGILPNDSNMMRADEYMPQNLDVIIKPVKEFELRRILLQILGTPPDGIFHLRFFYTLLPPVLVFIFFLLLWELSVRWLDIKEYLVPAPSRIASVIVSEGPSLLIDTAVTMSEALLGFFLANILSVFVAVGFSHSSWLERSFYPYVVALKSIPIIALAPLLVIWFGYGLTGKVIMAGIMAFFPLVVNATIGLKNVDADALELLHSLSASKWQILCKLRFPTAVPYILSALKISSALSVMGAIISEMTGASAGLGYTIMLASYNVDTPMLFAAVAVASLCGIVFFGFIALLEGVATKKFMFIPEKNAT